MLGEQVRFNRELVVSSDHQAEIRKLLKPPTDDRHWKSE